jgi:hypothetical protein
VIVKIGGGGTSFVGPSLDRSMSLSVPLNAKELGTHVHHNWFVDGFVFGVWGSMADATLWMREN